MRLIQRNRELAYEFKGREDAVENEVFAKSGLPAYSGRNERRSWKLDYPPGTILDFYLDEHEVTNAQYRAFMQATGHSGPDYLAQASYAFALDDEPVVLVTWEEAAAYAAWTGKRLPSYVEWEYAVRGGPLRYRLYSTWTPERAGPPEEIVAASGWSAVIEAAYTKHRAGSSSDVTPEGVHDLCGNVAEWTATPLFFGPSRPPNLMLHARENKAGYLRPWTTPGWDEQPVYWVVGGAFDLPGAHFARTDQRARDARLPDVGFRCAEDAESVLAGLGPPKQGAGGTYTEVQP
jgi:formylglycine-generating enzyme required for sulfatase activity